jgi:hypothetical protein
MTARTAPATAPMTPPGPPRDAAPDPAVAHPDWCDPARCTATPAATKGEAHRGTAATVTAERPLGDLTVTASLYQAHAPWLTSVLVELDISGRDEHWQPARLAATVTVEQAGDLARVLADLAADGAVRPTADDSSAVRAEVTR